MDVRPAMAGIAQPTMRVLVSIIQPHRHGESNMFDNKPTETQYLYTDGETTGASLDGKNIYEITFAPGQDPPVTASGHFLYNGQSLLPSERLKRYSLGTKNKTLKRNADGSLTLYAGTKSPARTRRATGSRPGRPLLALHPLVLGQAADSRRLLAAAQNREAN